MSEHTEFYSDQHMTRRSRSLRNEFCVFRSTEQRKSLNIDKAWGPKFKLQQSLTEIISKLRENKEEQSFW